MDEFEKWLEESHESANGVGLYDMAQAYALSLDKYRSMTCKMEVISTFGILNRKCSVCEHKFALMDNRMHYCPNCGRRVEC